MNTLRSSFPVALLAAAFILHPSSFILAQGLLTPPGAPAPTMKTLDQVEARTPISSAPFTISTSGSYYLTGNLTVTSGTAITIAADQVTLDAGTAALAVSTIHSTSKFADRANAGWNHFRPDQPASPGGIVFGEYSLSGFTGGANQAGFTEAAVAFTTVPTRVFRL